MWHTWIAVYFSHCRKVIKEGIGLSETNVETFCSKILLSFLLTRRSLIAIIALNDCSRL